MEWPQNKPYNESSLLAFRTHTPGSEMSRLPSKERIVSVDRSLTQDVVPWMARLTFRLPDGVVRHPSLLDGVRENIGRRCAIDEAHAGIAVSYKLKERLFLKHLLNLGRFVVP